MCLPAVDCRRVKRAIKSVSKAWTVSVLRPMVGRLRVRPQGRQAVTTRAPTIQDTASTASDRWHWHRRCAVLAHGPHHIHHRPCGGMPCTSGACFPPAAAEVVRSGGRELFIRARSCLIRARSRDWETTHPLAQSQRRTHTQSTQSNNQTPPNQLSVAAGL